MNKIWLDVTTIFSWNRPAVGVVRVEAESYQYVSPTTGEVMTLQHTYAYQPLGSMETIGHVYLPDPILAEQ